MCADRDKDAKNKPLNKMLYRIYVVDVYKYVCDGCGFIRLKTSLRTWRILCVKSIENFYSFYF